MGFDWTIALWLVFILIVGGVSFWLALRSMKGYEEFPKSNLAYNLYLVRTPENFTQETLTKIYNLSLQKESQISLERLIRGADNVLTLFMPEELTASFPELNLLPIEDYLGGMTNLEQSYVWSIENSKTNLGINPGFLNSIKLSGDEFFSLQVVAFPEKGKNNIFQVTLRGLVSYPEAVKRIKLTKAIQDNISKNSTLNKASKNQNTANLFENFLRRTFVPREVTKNHISSEQLYNLLQTS